MKLCPPLIWSLFGWDMSQKIAKVTKKSLKKLGTFTFVYFNLVNIAQRTTILKLRKIYFYKGWLTCPHIDDDQQN